MKEKVQVFGRFLSGMVMPNIGAFIAWGLITALFIPTGWIPNEMFAELVGPMISYLIVLLIAFTGGNMVYGQRGGVIGAIATMGVIVGAEVPMMLGAMIMGPLSAWIMKKFDALIDGKIKAGFEMLINNFSLGILGALLAIIALIGITPLVLAFNNMMAAGVGFLVQYGLLPLTSIFIEPAKILFLNNAINHGILSPLGIEQAKEIGSSVFFLLESNPGPGLGILLAYTFFGRGNAKASAPGAIIIHFFGGIHEIYFPYVLMNPALVLAAIAGGASGIFTFNLFGAGLVAPASPGSIFALLAMTPKDGYLGVIAGVLVATIVSFVVAVPLLKIFDKGEDDLEKAKEKMTEMKSGKTAKESDDNMEVAPLGNDIKRIVFACDAGMGSSAMGASILRKKIKEAGLSIEVINTAVGEIPENADIVITHEELKERAEKSNGNARLITITNFMGAPEYDRLVEELKK
ncbi:MAG: PTS mannitol transporter subunit IICB [Eubacteriaceae bacterium]